MKIAGKISIVLLSLLGVAGAAFGGYCHHNLHWYDEYEKSLKEVGAVEKDETLSKNL